MNKLIKKNNSPKISIITPVYNQVDFIEQTILSVINQKYNNLEYIIIDGGSQDGTVEIIKKYENHINKWISEPDSGMYDALNKGFLLSSGEIMGWINSDDILMPGALFNVAKVFTDIKEISWIQGMNSFIDLDGRVIKIKPPTKFSKLSFLTGSYKWIQQESTFWKRELWDISGGYIDSRLKLAGDFDLWLRFFNTTSLFSTDILIGAWRKRDNQLSSQIKPYILEVENILKSFEIDNTDTQLIKKIKFYNFIIKMFKKVRIFNYSFLIKKRRMYLNLPKKQVNYSFELKKYLIN